MTGRLEPERRQKLVNLAAQAIEAAWEEGCAVASTAYETDQIAEMARIAVRRWLSSGRRGVAPDRFDDRIEDLAKGLIERFEKDPRMVGPLRVDYEYLAGRIDEALSAQHRPVST